MLKLELGISISITILPLSIYNMASYIVIAKDFS